MTARLLVLALVCLAVGPLPAWSDGIEEKVWLQPADIVDDVLRRTDAVAFVQVLPEEPLLPSYRLQGSTFVPAGPIDISKATPVNGWAGGEGLLLRRFPVLDRRAGKALLALDGTSRATAWIDVPTQKPEVGQFPAVWVNSFVSPSPQGLDLYLLLGGERRKVYQRPAADAPYRVATRQTLSSSLFGRRIENGFLEIVESQDEGRTLIPRGWVRIRDAKGRLTLWYGGHLGC